jgi:GTPase SAR1 family protein
MSDEDRTATATTLRSDAPTVVRHGAAHLPGVTVNRPDDEGGTVDLRDPVPPEQRHAQLTRKVENLRTIVSGAGFDLEIPGVGRAREEQLALLRQLDDYVLPRLHRMDAPVLAVVGGSTGAGKSTLVNSLVRREVSRSGVLRPTTRSPVLVHHPYDSGAFLSQRILPGLARVTSEAPEPMQPIDIDAPRITAIRLVPDDAVAPGLGILDAPDIDSVVDTNRDLAVQLLSAADLWVFVTTAARYADDLPWRLLRQAVDRGAAVAIVLDRVPQHSMQEVRLHLATLLRDRGLAGAPMFTIPEANLDRGFLQPELVQPLMTWLTALARDPRTREVVVNRTLKGAVASLSDRAENLARLADEQNAAEADLLLRLDESFRTASDRVGEVLDDGSLVRGEVLARWRELVSTGEFFSSLEQGKGRGRSAQLAEPLGRALGSAIQGTVRTAALAAVRATHDAWLAHPAGAALLRGTARFQDSDPLDALAPSFDGHVSRAVAEWTASAGERVREAGRGGPGAGVLATLLCVGGPRTDDDPLHVGRTVLDAGLGPDAAAGVTRDLADALKQRMVGVLDEEQARFMERLDIAEARAVRGDKLRSVARAIKEEL